MPDDAQDIAQKQVTLIPTDRIRILNPRVRNRRTFEEMVENIAKIGLKRPITVAQRAGADPAEYDLVCGQGRLEAFMELQQDAIPAIVIDADESDCLVMSLVENCARRQHNPIDLMREIGALRQRGYNDRQIGEEIGVSTEYVNMIAGLLEKGEERLVSAVETGVLPLNLAIQISKTDANGAQKALMDAYTKNKLSGRKLALVRRLTEGDAALWGGSSEAVGMAANPLGAHQAGSSFRRPHGWQRPAMLRDGRAGRANQVPGTLKFPAKTDATRLDSERFAVKEAGRMLGSHGSEMNAHKTKQSSLTAADSNSEKRTERAFAAPSRKVRSKRAYPIERSVRRFTSCLSCCVTIISCMIASLWGHWESPGSDRHRPSAMRSNTSLIRGLVLSSR